MSGQSADDFMKWITPIIFDPAVDPKESEP
jgi:hypothetical protein